MKHIYLHKPAEQQPEDSGLKKPTSQCWMCPHPTQLWDVHLQAVAEERRFQPVSGIMFLQRGRGSLQHPTETTADQQSNSPLQIHEPHPGERRLWQGHPRDRLSKVRCTWKVRTGAVEDGQHRFYLKFPKKRRCLRVNKGIYDL